MAQKEGRITIARPINMMFNFIVEGRITRFGTHLSPIFNAFQTNRRNDGYSEHEILGCNALKFQDLLGKSVKRSINQLIGIKF